MSKYGIALTVFFLFLYGFLFAKQDKTYPATTISKELLQHADAVVRDYSVQVTVDEAGKTVQVITNFIVTVLNKKGRQAGDFSESYSIFERGIKLEGNVYNAAGKPVKKIKKTDFASRNSSPYSGFYDDVQVWGYAVRDMAYPYTVEYSTTSTLSHTFFLPGFHPQPDINCAVEHASYSITAPAWFKFRYKDYGYDSKTFPVVTDDNNGNKTYSWEIDNVNARKEESLEYDNGRNKGVVYLAPIDFTIGDFKGSNMNWESFSSFVYKLNEGMEELPESIKIKVKDLTEGLTDTLQKIQVLYKFLQDNTRYVAIEYGINGWQTMPAAYTAEKQYGDCKGLSYYMKALLKEAGIPSNTVLVHAGEENDNPIVTELPCPQFNHVILQVPLPHDTVWLECTSSELPAGYLSDFTQNRDVLVLAEKGGRIVRTPHYDTGYNKVCRTVTAKFNKDAVLDCEVFNLYYGEPALEVFFATRDKDLTAIDKYASDKFLMGSYQVKKASYKELKAHRNILLEERVALQATGMMSEAGKYTVLSCNLLPLELPELYDEEDRKLPFHINTAGQVTDSFVIDIPEGLTVMGKPEKTEETFAFGYYMRNIVINGNTIIVTRRFARHQGVYPPELYNDYVKWLDRVSKDATLSFMASAGGQ